MTDDEQGAAACLADPPGPRGSRSRVRDSGTGWATGIWNHARTWRPQPSIRAAPRGCNQDGTPRGPILTERGCRRRRKASAQVTCRWRARRFGGGQQITDLPRALVGPLPLSFCRCTLRDPALPLGTGLPSPPVSSSPTPYESLRLCSAAEHKCGSDSPRTWASTQTALLHK